jgi:hypothetical protein
LFEAHETVRGHREEVLYIELCESIEHGTVTCHNLFLTEVKLLEKSCAHGDEAKQVVSFS